MSGPRVARLDGTVQHYAWGSHRTLAALRERPVPSDAPEAELWFGAHPRGPSRLFDGRSPEALDTAIARDPVGMLGAAAIARFGRRLPFLLKVLAIERPLSLQVHPSAAEAREGFAREEAAGVAIDAPARNYRDALPKPELLVALTDVEVLAGFRDAASIVGLLDALDVDRLDAVRQRLVNEGEAAIGAVVETLLRWPHEDRSALVATLAERAGALVAEGHPAAPALVWLPRLRVLHHADPGIAVAVLLRHAILAPGEAVALPAGCPHAYLQGTAVECMAASDNVLRGGLTPKHVDVDELLRVLDVDPGQQVRLDPHPVAGGVAYGTPTGHFALERYERPARPVMLAHDGPQILLALGPADVVAGTHHLPLRAGQSVFVPAAAGRVVLDGEGPVFRATIGDARHDDVAADDGDRADVAGQTASA
jgi:mannose-6-phosphate isomerase